MPSDLKYDTVFEAQMVGMPALWGFAAMLHTVPAAPCMCFYHEIECLELILVVPSLVVASHMQVPSLTTERLKDLPARLSTSLKIGPVFNAPVLPLLYF